MGHGKRDADSADAKWDARTRCVNCGTHVKYACRAEGNREEHLRYKDGSAHLMYTRVRLPTSATTSHVYGPRHGV